MTNPERRPSLKKLLRDEGGAILLITTVYLPVIVGFFTLAVDMSYVLRMRNMLQVSAEAAALAATAQLPDPTTSCTQAKLYAHNNMDVGTYGDVLSTCNDVILGTWPQNCTGGTNCFTPLPGGSDCVAFHCNAVQATTRKTAANGNALQLAFAPLIGLSNFDVTATAIAVYGGNGIPWDLSIVQDISGSFTRPNGGGQGALPQAKDADKALLGCLNANAPAGSRLGMTVFTGTPQSFQIPSAVNTNYDTLKSKIDTLPQCYNSGPNPNGTPSCSTGTNIGAAIKSSATDYTTTPNPVAGTQKNIVIVTDGLPNSATGCTSGDCSAKGYAEAQADAAYDSGRGANIFTIYYCSGSSCASDAQTWLASLVRGSGRALVTPDPNNLTNLMGQICASQPHRLVW